MMKAWLLRLHRWLALGFALPLVLVLLTGLVLSFEPWIVARAIVPGSVTATRIEALLAQHDPRGQAKGIAYRSYDNVLTIGSGRGGSGLGVDVASGSVVPGSSVLAETLRTARRMHETLLIEANWLVIASTVAMLALVLIGALMGLPRITNTLSGWHKGVAWSLLPFIVLSPLTGLLVAARITLASPLPAAGGPPRDAGPSLVEAVRVLGQRHDLSALVWLRPMGGRVVARVVEDGEYRLYAVTPQGSQALPRNWPRLWHEGNFAGTWSAAMNVILSIAMTGLLTTGLLIWLRRARRRRAARIERAAALERLAVVETRKP